MNLCSKPFAFWTVSSHALNFSGIPIVWSSSSMILLKMFFFGYQNNGREYLSEVLPPDSWVPCSRQRWGKKHDPQHLWYRNKDLEFLEILHTVVPRLYRPTYLCNHQSNLLRICRGLLTSINFLAKSCVYLRRNLIHKGLRRSHIYEDSVIGFTEDLLHGVEGYKGFSGTRWCCSLYVNRATRMMLNLKALTHDQKRALWLVQAIKHLTLPRIGLEADPTIRSAVHASVHILSKNPQLPDHRILLDSHKLIDGFVVLGFQQLNEAECQNTVGLQFARGVIFQWQNVISETE